MSAHLADDELLIERTFDAPPALVFALWSEPAHLKNWMGPTGFDCPVAEVDFRVGGHYRMMIRSPEYGENWFHGTYREIVPHTRLVFTFTWDNDGPSANVETLITLLFREEDGRTVQVFHQTGFLSADRRDSHAGGWAEAFDKQQGYVEPLAREKRP